MSRTRVALVGTGGIAAEHHVPAIRALGDATELVAAADIDAARVEAFAEEHGIPRTYTDTGELLAAEQPALVHICTPPASHCELVVACLRAGAWAFCEKPPVTSLAELDRIEAVERETGRYCSFIFQWRSGSGARHLRQVIREGPLGRPLVGLCLTTWFRDPAYYDVPWRGRWSTEAGGPTISHGIHGIDLLLWLLGDWREVRGMLGRLSRDVETEDVSMATVRFENDTMASVVNSVVSPREESYLRLDFTLATVELRHLYGYANSDWRFTIAPHTAEDEDLTRWQEIPGDVPSTHEAQLVEIVDSMRAGARPPTTAPAVRPTMEFITAVYKSAITGQTVYRGTLSPSDPFYHQMHGGLAPWAPLDLERAVH